ncbi:MAG: hypothetical protein J0G32_03145 [Alphaproteobacteria bacterium]|nr:hypothetical protein [Alphaproteobacteria bacterium]OJV16323.1 MAG: hypothetical protein BGO27_03645 [Alphaproteobacteria bacterium 33-17]
MNRTELENLLEKAEEAENIYKLARKKLILSGAMVAMSMAGITVAVGIEELGFFIVPSIFTSISAAIMSATSGKKFSEVENMGFKIKGGKLTLSENYRIKLDSYYPSIQQIESLEQPLRKA